MILVFGGNGQLGQELARAAALQAIPIATLSRAEVDIAEGSAVASALSRIKPTLVVNAAAYTKVDLAETNVEEARRANEIGPAVIASACADAHLPMVHISTDYVFDGTKEGAYLESDPVCPINVYGRTKAAGEQAVRSTLKRHIILRTAWVYSEFGHNFLKTILHLAATREELRIVADQHGSSYVSTRDRGRYFAYCASPFAGRGRFGHISFHRGWRHHLARIREPRRRNSGAYDRPQSAGNADQNR